MSRKSTNVVKRSALDYYIIMKVYHQFKKCPSHKEDIDPVDMKSLDKTSITSVADFILRFQADKSFAPPEDSSMVYDSDISKIDIDKDVAPEMSYDFEELFDENNPDARATTE